MSGFSPVRQDTSGKFGCPVLSRLDTHMSSPVEAYYNSMPIYMYLQCIELVKIKSKVKTPDTQSRELELMTRKKLKPAIYIMNEHKRAKS